MDNNTTEGNWINSAGLLLFLGILAIALHNKTVAVSSLFLSSIMCYIATRRSRAALLLLSTLDSPILLGNPEEQIPSTERPGPQHI